MGKRWVGMGSRSATFSFLGSSLNDRANLTEILLETLRSGKEFSPYSFNVIRPGPEFPFSMASRFTEELASRREEDDWGYISDGEEFGGDEEESQVNGGEVEMDEASQLEAQVPHQSGAAVAGTAGSTLVRPHGGDDSGEQQGGPKRARYDKPTTAEIAGDDSTQNVKWAHLSDRARRERQKKRKRRTESRASSGSPVKSVVTKRAKEAASRPPVASINVEALRTTKSRWMGARQRVHYPLPWTFRQLREQKYRVFDWDGRTTHLIVDNEERVIGILGGQPRDQGRGRGGCPTYNDWKEVIDKSGETSHRVRSTYSFSEEQLNHRRGDFVAVDYGLSFGGGQRVWILPFPFHSILLTRNSCNSGSDG